MHEIEVKMKYENKENVLAKLKTLGAKFREEYPLNDTYFSLNATDMKDAKEFIRIRKKGEKSELTFKGKKETSSEIWKKIELTTSLGDSEAMNQILDHLGFNRILENKSMREYWMIGDVEIAFISLFQPTELDWLEIEAPSEEKVQKVLDQLNGLAETVGEEYFKKIDEAKAKKATNK
ncbi:MAG: class IV adenylate cyclase [Candidatus Nanoarchaeia archaeon]